MGAAARRWPAAQQCSTHFRPCERAAFVWWCLKPVGLEAEVGLMSERLCRIVHQRNHVPIGYVCALVTHVSHRPVFLLKSCAQHSCLNTVAREPPVFAPATFEAAFITWGAAATDSGATTGDNINALCSQPQMRGSCSELRPT
eukprot:GHUV01043359.1.p1 GENE.GHUV01043359.1~~GHUV01043359.1.p1  ORF type:complete len:143 (-),score=11.54 GHUV01043359.1:708-1136(-)